MRRGPLYMIGAGLTFTVMVIFVKIARDDLSAIEVIFWRSFVSIPLAILFAAKVGFVLKSKKLFLLRATFGFCAMVAYFTATKGIGVADLTLISKLQPIVIAVLAPFFLGKSESSEKALWLILFAGISGCALIIGPGVHLGSVYGLWALGAAVCAAGAHLCVRGLTRTNDARVIVLYFQIFVCIATTALLLLEYGTIPLPPPDLIGVLLGVGVFATAGQLLMTQAYAEDKAALVATAAYVAPLWGLLADIFIFATFPSWNVYAGGAIILMAGLTLLFSKSLLKSPPVEASM